jgi:hypothetical protein
LAPEKVKQLVAVPAPEHRTGYAGPLLKLEGAPPARVHQVVELPRVVPEVKQYDLHAGWWTLADRRDSGLPVAPSLASER